MGMKLDRTSTILVGHLKQKAQSNLRDKLISDAENLIYDDFGSPLATPKTQLYTDLTGAGYSDLAKNVLNGIYD